MICWFGRFSVFIILDICDILIVLFRWFRVNV